MTSHPLVEQILAAPERARRLGISGLLEKAIEDGLDVKVVLPLLRDSDASANIVGLEAAGETGVDLASIADAITPFLANQDPVIADLACLCMLRIRIDGPLVLCSMLSDPGAGLRPLRFLSRLDPLEIATFVESGRAKAQLSKEHLDGLSIVASGRMATNAEILALIRSTSIVSQAYGALAARALRQDRPELRDEVLKRTPQMAPILDG